MILILSIATAILGIAISDIILLLILVLKSKH